MGKCIAYTVIKYIHANNNCTGRKMLAARFEEIGDLGIGIVNQKTNAQ